MKNVGNIFLHKVASLTIRKEDGSPFIREGEIASTHGQI